MNKLDNYNGFKLIAIVPLKDCDRKFIKNLIIGKPYLFYNNYEVQLETENTSIKNVTRNQSDIPSKMYNLQNGIKVNVSAVVGPNGSGKSALIELFYYFIYAITSIEKKEEFGFNKYSIHVERELVQLKEDYNELKGNYDKLVQLKKEYNEIKINNDKLKKACRELESTISNIQYLSIKIQKKYNIQVELKNIKSDYYKLLIDVIFERIHFTDLRLKDSKNNDDFIDKCLNLGVIFELDDDFFVFELKEGVLIIKDKEGNDITQNFSYQNFFYTISLNYSHHSLNSNVIGEWINSLFHKNDGYKTPVVINPMRDDGMYDINQELYLSKERLMFNLAYYLIESQNDKEEYKILQKYKVKEIKFSIKPSSYPFPLKGTIEDLKELSSYFLLKDIVKNEEPLKNEQFAIIVGYLERKLEKIRRNYSDIIFKDFDEKDKRKEAYFNEFVLNDNSHITKKIKQTVNYLKYALLNSDSIVSSIYNLKRLKLVSFKSSQLIQFICNNRNYNKKTDNEVLTVLDLMNYLPPSIFDIDFEVTLDNNECILLSTLSSGEQQMIFNINTVMYHLYNLQSSFQSDKSRLVYKYVNILLDEIELYYHPEMQRQFLNNLLESIELLKVKKARGIESINICFLTHSPFILSDIVSENILKLENGKPVNKEININSFAANIYDLLNDEFFLKEGMIGVVAQKYILNLIKKIEKLNNKAKQSEIKAFKAKIEIIGEALIRSSLEDLLIEKTGDVNTEIDILEKRIKNLKANNNATN